MKYLKFFFLLSIMSFSIGKEALSKNEMLIFPYQKTALKALNEKNELITELYDLIENDENINTLIVSSETKALNMLDFSEEKLSYKGINTKKYYDFLGQLWPLNIGGLIRKPEATYTQIGTTLNNNTFIYTELARYKKPPTLPLCESMNFEGKEGKCLVHLKDLWYLKNDWINN